MSINLEQLYAGIANGNSEAFDFIVQWCAHCHRVDDIIDGKQSSEFILKAFVGAQDLMLHPFFKKHETRLYVIHVLAANAYADACELAQSGKQKDQRISDILRSYGNEMLCVVAGICAAENTDVWERMRKWSRIIRQESYLRHHTEDGQPI